jgi:phosphoribosyl 1,2-cyclic phosphodiesterase
VATKGKKSQPHELGPPAAAPGRMRLRLHGVRGSRPTHRRGLLNYGGNSTSFELTFDREDFYLFLDGGSGLVPRGDELAASPAAAGKRFNFLITHTHWDHILGFPFFKPIYAPVNQFNFYASNTTRSTFNDLFFGLQRSVNLPVPRDALKASLNFHSVAPGVPFAVEGKVQVDTLQLNHQGITLGYKVRYGQDSVAIITDNAPIAGGNYLGEGMAERAALTTPAAFESAFDQGLVGFLRGVHTVVFDTHFTETNLKVDWGHSTPERALAFAAAAGVKRLILFHHAPEEMDQAVDNKVLSIFHAGCHAGVEIDAAREGDVWPLSA